MAAFRCPSCGGNEYRLDDRGRRSCIFCGYIETDADEEAQEIAYRKAEYKARECYRAGDYQRVISLLWPFAQKFPARVELYRLVCGAATWDYTMAHPSMNQSQSGQEAWDRLVRLGCLNSEMRDYMQLLHRNKMAQINRSLRQVSLLLVFLWLSLHAGVHYYQLELEGRFWLATLCAVFLFWMVWCCHPLRLLIRRYKPVDFAQNPFRTDY